MNDGADWPLALAYSPEEVRASQGQFGFSNLKVNKLRTKKCFYSHAGYWLSRFASRSESSYQPVGLNLYIQATRI